MNKPKSITVIGKRWFDKVNGNTYCSSQVFFDGVLVQTNEYEYGYGSFYIQRAAEMLLKNNILPDMEKYERGGSEALWRYCDRNGIVLNDQVFDVKRKNDLKFF